MGNLFKYFSEHASYSTFDIAKFLDIQCCPNKHSAISNFKIFVEGIKGNESSKQSQAKAFANTIINDNYAILQQKEFINYWNEKSKMLTRSKLRAVECQQALRQVDTFAEIIETVVPDKSESEGSLYTNHQSTPSPSSSVESSKVTYQYLTHDGDSYKYKLKKNSVRWRLKNSYDVSRAFFTFRDSVISKAEDYQTLNDQEQLALDGILVIDNDLVNTDIMNYKEVKNILTDIDKVNEFKCDRMKKSQQKLVNKFADDLGSRRIDVNKVRKYIKKYEDKNPEEVAICRVLYSIMDTYTADYSTSQLNEATIVRDTIDTFFKAFFPNNDLTKSIGADAMIADSSDRFLKMDPTLKNHGKRADFSVLSSKSGHALLMLEAKSNKTRHINELVKLAREMKDAIKAINKGGHFGVIVTGILMKGNLCEVFCMDHAYDGLYRMVLLKKIYLPSDCYQMHLLSSIFPVFKKLQDIVQSSAEKLRNHPSAAAVVLDEIVSMHTPTIIRLGKRKAIDRNDHAILAGRRKLF